MNAILVVLGFIVGFVLVTVTACAFYESHLKRDGNEWVLRVMREQDEVERMRSERDRAAADARRDAP